MLRLINFILLIVVLINGFYLVNQRYKVRQTHIQLSLLQRQVDNLNQEYTRLQLEVGTYSSDLEIQDYATHKLGLVQASKQHLMELK